MRRLSIEEIEGFASLHNAQASIVTNILSTINPESPTGIGEIFFLARLQGWQRETVQAILAGLAQAATRRHDEEFAGVFRRGNLRFTRQNNEAQKPIALVKRLTALRKNLLRGRSGAIDPRKVPPHHPRGGVLGLRDGQRSMITPVTTCLKPQEEKRTHAFSP